MEFFLTRRSLFIILNYYISSFMRKSEFEPNFGFDFEIGSEFGAYKLLRRAKDPFKFNSSSKFDSNSYSQSESSTYGFGFLQ